MANSSRLVDLNDRPFKKKVRQTKPANSAPKTDLIIYSSLKTSQYKQFIVRPGLQLPIQSIFNSQIDHYSLGL